MSIEEKILAQNKLNILVENINEVSQEEFALVRKNTFGGSDSSVLCGVNLYKTLDELIKEKKLKYLTEEEKEIGNKPAVKKGRELEPFILGKAEEHFGKEIYKPTNMYELKETKALTINFDGVMEDDNNILVPVEAKLVTKYGEKYYNKLITEEVAKEINMDIEAPDLANHIKKKSLRFGIPAYYYTQVQQQMMGLDTDYGYLIAMFDDSWTYKVYYIKKDEFVQHAILERANDLYESIQN